MEHLIPDAWFQAIESYWILLAIVAAAVAVLTKGADGVVEGASGLAVRLGVGKVIVGATVVSLGTTTPEAAVSVMAAWSGNPDLALGNGIGSIVCDTGLIFGLSCLLTRLPADRFVLRRQGWMQLGSGALLVALAFGARALGRPELGRGVGFLLLALLVAYLVASIGWARQHRDIVEMPENVGEGTTARDLGVLGVGLVLVLFASRVLIGSVTVLALRLGVPDAVIAATLVAFGTSLPELVTALTAIRRGHPELLVGNVLGADVLNVLFVIGASAVAAPLLVPDLFYRLHLPAMLLILVMFRAFAWRAETRGFFHRWTGVPFLIAYVAYVAAQWGAPS